MSPRTTISASNMVTVGAATEREPYGRDGRQRVGPHSLVGRAEWKRSKQLQGMCQVGQSVRQELPGRRGDAVGDSKPIGRCTAASFN